MSTTAVTRHRVAALFAICTLGECSGCDKGPTEPMLVAPLNTSGSLAISPQFPVAGGALTVQGTIAPADSNRVTSVTFSLEQAGEVAAQLGVSIDVANQAAAHAPQALFPSVAAGTYELVMAWHATTPNGSSETDGTTRVTVVVSECGPGPMVVGDEAMTFYCVFSQCTSSTQTYRAGESGLPPLQLGKAYVADLALTGGVAPLQFAWVSAYDRGPLDLGLAIDASGHITGTPPESLGNRGVDSVGLLVTDACASGGRALLVPLELLTLCGKRSPVPNAWTGAGQALVGVPFSRDFEIGMSWGSVTVVIESQSGEAPFRIVERDAHFFLEGTPMSAGSVTVTVAVSDRCDPVQTGRQTFTVNVAEAPKQSCQTTADCTAFCAGRCAEVIPYCETAESHQCYCTGCP